METNKLIDRLRELSKIGIVNYKHDTPVLIEAADRIEELDERIAIMQESLEAQEKRNEPIEPIVVPIGEDDSIPFIRYKCPKCGMFQIEFKPNYCSGCGQAVKWE